MTQANPKPPVVDELPPEIASLRRLIFDWTGEDVETRLRMFVAHVRGSKDVLPKAYYTDIIQDIYAIDRLHLVQAMEGLKSTKEFDSDLGRALQINRNTGIDDCIALLTPQQHPGKEKP